MNRSGSSSVPTKMPTASESSYIRNSGVPHSRQNPRVAMGDDRLEAAPSRFPRTASTDIQTSTANGPDTARRHWVQWQ